MTGRSVPNTMPLWSISVKLQAVKHSCHMSGPPGEQRDVTRKQLHNWLTSGRRTDSVRNRKSGFRRNRSRAWLRGAVRWWRSDNDRTWAQPVVRHENCRTQAAAPRLQAQPHDTITRHISAFPLFTDNKSRTFEDPQEKFSSTFSEPGNVWIQRKNSQQRWQKSSTFHTVFK